VQEFETAYLNTIRQQVECSLCFKIEVTRLEIGGYCTACCAKRGMAQATQPEKTVQ
jgi:hypothetical protein